MAVLLGAGVGAMLMAATVASAHSKKPAGIPSSFPLVELRQYTLHDGQRDVLIDLFERQFIESQEALGMKVIGTFRDMDKPDRFVWLRGFKDMDSRGKELAAFYYGPVWQAHREKANATIVDSDNVLLLHAPDAAAEFKGAAPRAALGEHKAAGLVVATIYYLKSPPEDVLPIFEHKVGPRLQRAGIRPLAWLVTEGAENNFPRLPVRAGEKVLVWFARFSSEADHAAHQRKLDEAAAALQPWLQRPPEVLRLVPTERSELR